MKKIFLLFAVFSLLLAGCENPLMERILGNNNNDGEKPGSEPVITPIPPENLSTAERWSTWKADDSTATVDYSVGSNDVCTITVSGTAMTALPAWDNVWKVNASYAYTAEAGKTYVYTFEAWTEGDDRTMTIQWYSDNANEVYHNTGYDSQTTQPTFTITSEQKRYILKASDYENDPIPKSGVQQLEFQCANQLGTFYVKIISIIEENGGGEPDVPFDLQAEVDICSNAGGDMTIRVPGNLNLTKNITIPNAGGHTLTITSANTLRTLSRSSEGTAETNALFIVSGGAKLVFENIIIDGNKATHTNNAVPLVRVESGGEFTLKDGAVLRNNKAYQGGGVYVAGGTFTMNGGEISGNSATSDGGGVYINDGTFTMTSGKITENTAGAGAGGGGVYFRDGYFIVGGTAKIFGNFQGDTPSKNKDAHLYCADPGGINSRYITLGSGANAPDAGPDGMVIYVSINEHYPHNGVIVQNGATDAIAKCFHADDAGKKVSFSDNQLKLVDINDGMTGSSTAPFKVYDKATLQKVGRGTGDYVEWDLTKCYELVADIDLTNTGNWTPIGISFDPFTGTFNGNGKTITGLTITNYSSSDSYDQGMFGAISGTVENLTLVNCNITVAGNHIGGIVGVNYGEVRFCSVSGNITGGSAVGGIVGDNSGTVENCYSAASVSGDENSCENIGGVVGMNSDGGVVKNCYARGVVYGGENVGSQNFGGIIGYNEGTVQNCYALGDVYGYIIVGGVAGFIPDGGKLMNCVALNQNIYCKAGGANNGRVFGTFWDFNNDINNNYGNSDMICIDGNDEIVPAPWIRKALNNADGADVYPDQYNNQTWWENIVGWNFTNVWMWDSSKNLPKLRNVGGR